MHPAGILLIGMVVDVTCGLNAFAKRLSDNNIVDYQISKTSRLWLYSLDKKDDDVVIINRNYGSSLVMASWDIQPSF